MSKDYLILRNEIVFHDAESGILESQPYLFPESV